MCSICKRYFRTAVWCCGLFVVPVNGRDGRNAERRQRDADHPDGSGDPAESHIDIRGSARILRRTKNKRRQNGHLREIDFRLKCVGFFFFTFIKEV